MGVVVRNLKNQYKRSNSLLRLGSSVSPPVELNRGGKVVAILLYEVSGVTMVLKYKSTAANTIYTSFITHYDGAS